MSLFGSGGGGDSGNELDETCSCFTLTREQRLYGFCFCFGFGFLLSLLGTFCLITANLVAFALLYTFGNIISLMGTGFLVGMFRQFKMMFDPIRIVATIVFFVSMGLTIMFAFIPGFGGLAILMVVVQFCAFTWYCASYIPYGRAMIKKCASSICDI